MKTNRIGHNSTPALEALQLIQQALAEKSSHERRIEGVIRRLLDTDDPDERLVIDEIKAAVRVIFPHLTFTDDDLNKLISEAQNAPAENRKVGRGWFAVNMSKTDVTEVRKIAAIKGMTFRLFCESAMREAMYQARKRLGLASKTVSSLTPCELGKLLTLSAYLRRMPSTYMPEKN